MNEQSQWRLTIARHIASSYAVCPHVSSIIVGGSTTRGHADRYSDIEIGVFWAQPPTDEERQAAVERTGGDLIYLYPHDAAEDVWSDDIMMGRSALDNPKSGVLVEIGNYTVEHINAVLGSVLQEFDPDELKQNLITGILDGIPLYNHVQIQEWQARAREYPRGLALAVIRRHAQIDHFWRWEMFLYRDENLMMLYQAFVQVQQKLLHVLLALNRVYYFGFKWLPVVIERLLIAPPYLFVRLKDVYCVEPAAGALILTELVEETYTLVEQYMPEIDIEWFRKVFRYQRPVWDEMPPGISL